MQHTLVIPNYNGSQNIPQILSQAVKENFDQTYLIDDASSDDSVAVAEEYAANHSNLKIISNKTNVGPGANRSRVLSYDMGDIITFVDVDMNFQTTGWVEKIEQVFQDEKVGVVGWRINTKENAPMWWHYGYEMDRKRDKKANRMLDKALKHWNDEAYIEELRPKILPYTYNLEISYGEQKEREVDWVTEAAFSIRSSVFHKIGGYDTNMRYHENQDLCKRVRNEGYKVVYSPEIEVMHLGIDSYDTDRERLFKENAEYFFKKHGLE